MIFIRIYRYLPLSYKKKTWLAWSHASDPCIAGIFALNDLPVLNREENWREWPLAQMLK